MPAHTYPRRATSTATTITVNSSATALSTAAAGVASNGFSAFLGNGSTTTTVHPISGLNVTPFEDGSTPSSNYVLGWSGKGWYDPALQRAGFLGTGAGSNNYEGAWLENTYTRFDETTNLWTAPHRAERPPNDLDPLLRGWVHQYDSNCIDLVGRKVYRKDGSRGRFVVYNLTTDTQENAITVTPVNNGTYWWGAMDCIPSRGTAGALWYFGWGSGNTIAIWEYDIAAGTMSATPVVSNAALGSPSGDTGQAPVLSYNPRAFSSNGNKGGVMIGHNNSVWTVDVNTLTVATRSAPAGSLVISRGSIYAQSGFCRDPVGDGWLQFDQITELVYRWTGSAWETRASLPAFFDNAAQRNFMVIPIDAYGVVWLVNHDGTGPPTGYLYRP